MLITYTSSARLLSRVLGARANAAHRTSRTLVFLAVIALASACATEPEQSLLPVEAPVSGFKPIYPEQRVVSTENVLIPSDVNSLQPTLRWEGFPGVHETYGALGLLSGLQEVPFVQIDPERVENITYDLRVWRIGWMEHDPEGFDLVYERKFLPVTEHQLEEKLRRFTLYFWSIRARFELDGQARLTEWSMANLWYYREDGIGTIYARDIARTSGRIPFDNYYRFQTPGR